MNQRALSFIVLGTLGTFGAVSTTAAGGPHHAGKRCPSGFVQVVVSRRHVCRPAPDLRVSAAATPTANRVGGSFTYEVTVRNVGRAPARHVKLSADAAAETLAISAAAGTCTSSQGQVHSVCTLGALRRGATVTVSIVARAATVGVLRLSVRAISSARDAHPKDNAATKATKVTEPDSVKGIGVRPTFGGGVRPPVTNEIEAISGPTGEDPAGTFRIKYPTFELSGRVVCLTVTGNRASVGGIIEQSNEAQYPVGRAVQLAFTDNGDPGVAKDTQVTYPGIDSASPCPVPLFDSQPELALIDGNYAVHDAQP
jgi:hypothetical protein